MIVPKFSTSWALISFSEQSTVPGPSHPGPPVRISEGLEGGTQWYESIS